MKWEYWIHLKNIDIVDGVAKQVQDQTNVMGNDGWELASVVPLGFITDQGSKLSPIVSARTLWVFKRPFAVSGAEQSDSAVEE